MQPAKHKGEQNNSSDYLASIQLKTISTTTHSCTSLTSTATQPVMFTVNSTKLTFVVFSEDNPVSPSVHVCAAVVPLPPQVLRINATVACAVNNTEKNAQSVAWTGLLSRLSSSLSAFVKVFFFLQCCLPELQPSRPRSSCWRGLQRILGTWTALPRCMHLR